MIVQVALPIPVSKTFSYAVPPSWNDIIEPFQRVTVTFRERTLIGYVTACEAGNGDGLKDVLGVVDLFPPLNESLIRLSREAAMEWATPQGLVLRYMLPPRMNLNRHLFVGEASPARKELANTSFPVVMRRLGWEEAFRLVRRGELHLRDRFTGRAFGSFSGSPPRERGSRTVLAAPLEDRMAAYAEVVGRAMAEGGNSLVMVPDHHAVGKYVYDYLCRLFPGRIFRYGSTVRHSERMEACFRARQEKGLAILGSIGCVFLPIRALAAIIIERPQEEDFRHEEGFRFSAVAMAVKRAELEQARLLAGSLTPTVDLRYAASTGAFDLVEKPCPPVAVEAIDVTEERGGDPRALPGSLAHLIEEAVRNGRVAAVYTPRKDYSGLIRCLECASPFLCLHCRGRLSYRKDRNIFACNRCGRSFPYEEHCNRCGSDLVTISATGAEWIEEQVRHLLRGVPVVRVTGENLAEDPLGTLRDVRGPAVIVGTRALARLYGVHADVLFCLGWEELLKVGGYRAEEKVLQLFANLCDALTPERCYITKEAGAPVDEGLLFDPRRFYEAALENRRLAAFPPFSRFFLVSWAGVSEKRGDGALAKVMQVLDEAGLRGTVTGPVHETKGKLLSWKLIVRQKKEATPEALCRLWDVQGVRVEADPPDL
jgi:primosomal protein N'